MKKNIIPALVLLMLFASCKKQTGWVVHNILPVERPDEVLVFTRNRVAAKLAIPGNKLPVFTVGDTQLASQTDDLDGDGKWDEAAVLVDLPPSGSQKIILSFVNPEEYPVFNKRTNLRLGIRQPDGSFAETDHYQAPSCRDSFRIIAQGESVNWENDKFGFRTYFDCRNVKDLFGKRTPAMVADSLELPGFPSYHELASWGMDVLHCGSSLGSGGLALLLNDSLYRLGSAETYEYHKIAEGPVRSVFELRYAGWKVEDRMLGAVERISIYPGKYWFQSDVTVTDLPGNAEIVTGIVTSRLKREPFEFRENGFTCIGTHDIQSLNNDELGMAVLVAENQTGRVARTTNINFFELGYQTVREKNFSQIISETYYISQRAASGKPARHYFAAVWGLENDRWKTEEGFRDYLSGEMLKLANPPSIRGIKEQP